MIQHPLVSIIVPTYNAAKWIDGTIESIFNQDFKDFEILIIDDGSTDNTFDVLINYLDYIRYIKKENGGTASARNLGIKESKGKYIAFLDADDLWEKSKLKTQISFLEETDYSWVYSDADAFDETTGKKLFKFSKMYSMKSGNILTSLFFVDFIPSPTLVVLKSIFSAIGYFNEQEFFNIEDYEMWLRIAEKFPIGYINQTLAKYRIHSNSKTNSTNFEELLHQEELLIIKMTERNQTLLGGLKNKRLAINNARAAGKYARCNNWVKARELYKKAIKIHPLFFKGYVGWLSCFMGGLPWKLANKFREKYIWLR